MGEVDMKKIFLIALIGVLASCMQLEEIEIPASENTVEISSSSSTPQEASSSSLEIKPQVEKNRLDTIGISYYDAIRICNKMSIEEGLDSLYQYDKSVFVDDSLFWLQNIKVLENLSGYRLPTREEWSIAQENGELEDIDEDISEWLYSESTNSQYSAFGLAPKFLTAVGLYRSRADYPDYGMRVVKVKPVPISVPFAEVQALF
jgi:hypothetical protein